AAIAHPPIRNMGTIGGAICHADPAADYPPALVAAGASIEITGREGRRTVAAGEFFVDYFTTAVEAAEIVTAIDGPRPAERSAGHFLKYARVDGDYATVSVAGILAMNGGTCSAAQFAIGACAATPVRAPEAEQALVGSKLDKAALDAAAAALLELC